MNDNSLLTSDKYLIIELDNCGKALKVSGDAKYGSLHKIKVGESVAEFSPEVGQFFLSFLANKDNMPVKRKSLECCSFELLFLAHDDTISMLLFSCDAIQPECQSVTSMEQLSALPGVGAWRLNLKTDALTWNEKVAAILGRASKSGSSYSLQWFSSEVCQIGIETLSEAIESLDEEMEGQLTEVEVKKRCGAKAKIDFFFRREGENIVGVCLPSPSGKELDVYYENIYKHSSIGIGWINTEGLFLKANKAFHDMLGYSDEKLSSVGIKTLLHSEEQDTADILKVFMKEKPHDFQSEMRLIQKNGDPIWVNMTISPFKKENGTIVDFVVQIQDISKRKKSEGALLKAAHYDALTDLPNRRYFLDVINSLSRAEAVVDQKLAVMFIDLNTLKRINDTYGIEIGDIVIGETASRIKKSVSDKDFVSRLGGDEFGVLLQGHCDEAFIMKNVAEILKEIKAPFFIENYEYNISCTIGVSIYPETTKDIQGLLTQAESALHKAKSIANCEFMIFTQEIRDEQVLRTKIETRLAEALSSNALTVVYQPQFHVGTKVCCGFEALVRWNDPELHNIGPEIFIPIAEEALLIQKIDMFVIEKVFERFQEAMKNNVPVSVSINMSALTLSYRDIVEKIENLTKKYSIPPEKVVLEVTETGIMEDIAQVGRTLAQFSKRGFKIAIDDFGTGYSSLQYLRDLPLDIIKIDRSFINKIIEDQQTRMVVKAAIEMGHAVGAIVVAEGVETTRQLELLEKLGCNEIQGYLLGKPTDDPFSYLPEAKR